MPHITDPFEMENKSFLPQKVGNDGLDVKYKVADLARRARVLRASVLFASVKSYRWIVVVPIIVSLPEN